MKRVNLSVAKECSFCYFKTQKAILIFNDFNEKISPLCTSCYTEILTTKEKESLEFDLLENNHLECEKQSKYISCPIPKFLIKKPSQIILSCEHHKQDLFNSEQDWIREIQYY